MIYIAPDGRMYLIYLYSEYRDIWKIEDYPFTGNVMEVSESYVKKFIKDNKLKGVTE